MINFKSTGFSHVSMSTLHAKLSTYVFLTTFSFLYAQKFQEIQISLIYPKLKLHRLWIDSLHISSQLFLHIVNMYCIAGFTRLYHFFLKIYFKVQENARFCND